MPLYRRGPFQRNSVERRSLRWRPSSLAASAAALSSFTEASTSREAVCSDAPKRHRKSRSHAAPLPPRTSVDLELDLLAQNKRLEELQEELEKLRELKRRLEEARVQGNHDIPAWLSEDDRLQALLEHVSPLILRMLTLRDANCVMHSSGREEERGENDRGEEIGKARSQNFEGDLQAEEKQGRKRPAGCHIVQVCCEAWWFKVLLY